MARTAPGMERRAAFRTDVHALRAVAVLAVLGYHLAGTLGVAVVPGGFAGVDVFFVVSGFLITGLLRRELEATGRVRLAAFWARRARRLAPAALLVIAASGAASLVLLPREDWPRLGTELAASAVAVENWALAGFSVDYLAQGQAATPFQHYWSLGVEEQFYLVWPLLLVGWRVLRRLGRDSRRGVAVLIAVVTAGSFAASVVLTATDPGPAYFWPHTRAWELGVGALLALAPGVLPARLRTPAAGLGWLGVLAAVVLLRGDVPYPGVAALAPVAATALVIAAARQDGVAGRLQRLAPVRMLGDLSYPLYLWHWPVLLLLPEAIDLPGPATAALAVGLAATLAWLTRRFVEAPVQRGRLAGLRPRTTLALTAGAVALVLLAPAVGWGALTRQVSQDRQAAIAWQRDEPDCFGAAALDAVPGCPLAGDEGVTPSTASAEFDISADWDVCRARTGPARDCVVGEPGGTRVALVGDSHAHHWVTAVEEIAERQGWEVTLLFAGGCDFSRVAWRDASDADAERCADWNDRAARRLAAAEPFRYVLTSARADGDVPEGDDPEAAAVAGYRAAWQPLLDRGTTVVAIRDTPASTQGTRGCVDANPRDSLRCAVDEPTALADRDWLTTAARHVAGVRSVDLTDRFCRDGVCPPVIGNVLVNRDAQHLTATYARTLGPYLWAAIKDVTSPTSWFDEQQAAVAAGRVKPADSTNGWAHVSPTNVRH